ncbi:putative polysaccharide biosynthesis protein [Virgibacillus sp. W0181]|uniref:putative polysaccharide biosynthesis protein n=1 Tax=Virgibacillus sp. W0181 TaxID=3391581 RepID=UPI003F47B0A8
MSNFVRGTMLLTGASFLSKFLGMIYVIPFNALVGGQGGALYYYAYNPYTILISISTVGVPLAVSKFISKYNSLGDYETGMRMFRAGLTLMAITGLLSFLVLFFSADWLANIMIHKEDTHGNTVEDVKMVIQMVSFALLIIPGMSIVRGFFQGHQSMGPTAVSQVVEQIIRIAFVLIGVFLVVQIFDGSIPTAVGFATFAAFVGALASCIVLWIYWIKRKDRLRNQLKQQKTYYDLSKKDLFIELFQYAGPFVLVGIAIPLYQSVDTFTFNRAMDAINQSGISEFALSAINLYGHKLVIIPVTLATGLSLAILPVLTKSFTQNNRELLFQQINQALQIIIVLVVPAVIGMSVLSDVAYGSFYGFEHFELTSSLLAWYAPVALLFALFTVSAAVLQGINEQRFSLVSLGAGFLIKALFNMVLIHTFGAKGAIIATGLAVGTAVVLNLWRINYTIHFSYKQIVKRFLLVMIFSIIMLVTILLVKLLLGMIISYEESRLGAIVMLVGGVSIGGIVYLWFAYQSTLLERTLGSRIAVLERFIRKF